MRHSREGDREEEETKGARPKERETYMKRTSERERQRERQRLASLSNVS